MQPVIWLVTVLGIVLVGVTVGTQARFDQVPYPSPEEWMHRIERKLASLGWRVTPTRLVTDGGVALGRDRDNHEREKIVLDTGLSRDVIELIHFVTQDTRYTLLMNMWAHPKQAPSQEELVYLYPDKSRTAIVEALDKLIEWGFVNKLVIPAGERERSMPNTFYELSDVGQAFLKQYRLLPDLEELQEKYQELPKPDRIRRAEQAPRDDAVVVSDSVDECRVAQVKAVVDASADIEDQSLGEKVSSVVHKLIS